MGNLTKGDTWITPERDRHNYVKTGLIIKNITDFLK